MPHTCCGAAACSLGNQWTLFHELTAVRALPWTTKAAKSPENLTPWHATSREQSCPTPGEPAQRLCRCLCPGLLPTLTVCINQQGRMSGNLHCKHFLLSSSPAPSQGLLCKCTGCAKGSPGQSAKGGRAGSALPLRKSERKSSRNKRLFVKQDLC